MFHTVEISSSTDQQGNDYTSVRRYDNHGKLGFDCNQCGNGRMYRTGNVDRITAILRATGFHHMYGLTYGKFVA